MWKWSLVGIIQYQHGVLQLMWNQTFATENNSGNFSWNRKTPDTGEQTENMDTYTSELDRIYEELWNTLVKETQDKGASDSGKLKEWLAKYQQTRLRKDALDQLNQITERMEKIEERNRNRLRVSGALTYGAPGMEPLRRRSLVALHCCQRCLAWVW